MRQYQEEERSLIARRYVSEMERLKHLMGCMKTDRAEPFDKVVQLRQELGEYHKTSRFDSCNSMGEIVERNLDFLLVKHLA
jgi:hypothetical protein